MELLIHFKKDGAAEILSEGSGADIVNAFGTEINHIYSDLLRANAGAAMGFRMAMVMAVGLPDSPVWKPSSDGKSTLMFVPKKTGGTPHDQ